MRGRRMFRGVVVALSCACVLTCSVAFSEVTPDAQIARTNISAAAISWTPLTDFKTAVLTVSGPGDLFLRRVFAGGEAIRLDVIGNSVGALEDGQYAWELRFSPQLEPEVEEAIRKARETGDESAINRLRQQGKIPEGGVSSGYFRVKDGSIVVGDTELEVRSRGPQQEPSGSTDIVDADSPIATKDFVIADDLIVDGSACIGFDCVNGESFGFDTIRLKENNLRIKAQDTSATSSFPTNDWQITFNDSSNGGANKFSIDDIDGGRTPFTVEAGARSNALYVESDGDIGIGTNNPVVDLHVVTGNTPTLRLEQDGSSGFIPQTWDVAGNEANFFIRDATNGSTLPFRIRPGAPSSAIDIAATGNVGIGTASPTRPIHIVTNSSTNAEILAERAGGAKIYMNATADFTNFGSVTDHPVRIAAAGGWRMTVNSDNSLVMRSGASCTAGGVWTSVSSKEHKENIRTLSGDEAISALEGLNPVKFNYKAEKGEEYVGFIAEEVPDLVATNDRKTMSSMDVIAVLTKVVKEQQAIILNLQSRVTELEK